MYDSWLEVRIHIYQAWELIMTQLSSLLHCCNLKWERKKKVSQPFISQFQLCSSSETNNPLLPQDSHLNWISFTQQKYLCSPLTFYPHETYQCVESVCGFVAHLIGQGHACLLSWNRSAGQVVLKYVIHVTSCGNPHNNNAALFKRWCDRGQKRGNRDNKQ